MRKLFILFGFALPRDQCRTGPRNPRHGSFPDNISTSGSILAGVLLAPAAKVPAGTFAANLNNWVDLLATSAAAKSPAWRRAARLMKSTTCSGRAFPIATTAA